MAKTPPFVNSMAVYYDGLASANGLKIVGRNFGLSEVALAATTDIGGTSRFEYIPVSDISKIACLVSSQFLVTAGSGKAEASGHTTINQVYYELYGKTAADGRNGKLNIVSESSVGMVQSDGVGMQIPALTPFYVRMYQTFAFLPSGTPTATAVAGGSLAAQPWYYVVTRTMQGYESSPTAEFTATTAAANLAIAITIVDTKSATADYYTIYRSSASGGTKQYLGQTSGRTKLFVDDGSLTVDTTITPPAAGKTYFGNRITAKNTDCSTHISFASQDGRNVASGAYTFSATGPSYTYGVTPICILGDDRSGRSILVLGDSIFAGTGFGQQTPYYRQEYGCWEQSYSDGEINSLNWSFPGASLCEILHSTTIGGGRSRLKSIPYADWVFDELGTNDITLGRTWQQLANDKLALAAICKRFGVKYVTTTILPRGTSLTSAGVTIEGQTPQPYDAQRISFNTWVRAGCPVDGSGVADITGNPSPLIHSFVDIAASVEVNASNVLTLNGGYWLVPTAPIASGIVLTGTPTATSLPTGTTLVTHENIGRAIKITSGARSGQYAVVKSNDTSTYTLFTTGDSMLGVTALSGAPSAGDTFEIYETNAADSVHPSRYRHAQLAAVIRTWLLANVLI